jgi:hypothetical protein
MAVAYLRVSTDLEKDGGIDQPRVLLYGKTGVPNQDPVRPARRRARWLEIASASEEGGVRIDEVGKERAVLGTWRDPLDGRRVL